MDEIERNYRSAYENRENTGDIIESLLRSGAIRERDRSERPRLTLREISMALKPPQKNRFDKSEPQNKPK